MSKLLFRYFSDHGDTTLREKRLLVSSITKFNDPFEGCYHSVPVTPTQEQIAAYCSNNDRTLVDRSVRQGRAKNRAHARRILKRTPAKVAETFGKDWGYHISTAEKNRPAALDKCIRAVSFSGLTRGSPNEVLMWSHYSNKHSGMRIGFEFPPHELIAYKSWIFRLEPVHYQDEQVSVQWRLNELDSAECDAQRKLAKSLFVKSTVWLYEEEYRLITNPEDLPTEYKDGRLLEYLPFDIQCVKQVDFGLRYDQVKRDELIKQLLGEYPNVHWYQARMNKKTFALEYEEIQCG